MKFRVKGFGGALEGTNIEEEEESHACKCGGRRK
jgi:hypothetical protein